MMTSTTKIQKNSVHQLFESAQATGFRIIFCSEATSICCVGGAGGVVDLLVERKSLTEFSKFLEGFGFYRVATSQSASTVTVEKYLGYCEDCAALMQLNVFTDVTVGNLSGNHMVLRSTAGLFDSVAHLGMQHTSDALGSIAKVCAASMLYEYQVRARRKLMVQARESFELCDPSAFKHTSIALVGEEASGYVVKLMEVLPNWEVDLLLQELRGILEKTNRVDYNPGRLFSRKTDTAADKKQRLTDAHANTRRAPIVVISRTDAIANDLQQLERLFINRIDTRIVSFCTTDTGEGLAENQSNFGEMSLFARSAQVISALSLAGRNFLRFKKVDSLSAKGVVVLVPGYPVVDFPDGFNLPKLKHLSDSHTLLWRLAARIERAIYKKISAGIVDCLIVLNPTKHSIDNSHGDADIGLTKLDERRRVRAMTNLPVKYRHKKVIDADASTLEAQSVIVDQVLVAAADR